ncbi:venom allergen-1-like [Cochliomyia hominivorax]
MYFIAYLFVAVALAVVNATDYCSSSICNNVKHIACDHNGQFDASCPADAKMVTITDDLKKVVVDAHNEKRNYLAGGGDTRFKPACRMPTMEWDDELAYLASLNVRQCKMAHDKCHNTDAFKYSGQNLAYVSFYNTADNVEKLKQMVDIWFSEINNAKQSYMDAYPNGYNGPTIGHFTVMMAERNIRVGCAASTFSVKDQSYKLYLVACNYATTNVINFPIYKSCSKAATSCTTGTNPRYPNLCSTAEKIDVNKFF